MHNEFAFTGEALIDVKQFTDGANVDRLIGRKFSESSHVFHV